MYRSEVQTRPSPPRAGDPVALQFTIRDGEGRPVPQLQLAHEKPMHLMIVSKDLDHFAHVHPSSEGDGFRLVHRFDEGGDYLLVADYQQPGRGQVIDRHQIHVEGVSRPAVSVEESPRTQRTDDLELTLRTEGELRAGEAAMLHFDAVDMKTGSPVADFEPYLGAKAHFMVLSADGEDFIHVHAVEEPGIPSRVSAHAVFPRPGLYKLWAQMQRRGEVLTIPFVLRVAAPGAKAAHEGGHSHHRH